MLSFNCVILDPIPLVGVMLEATVTSKTVQEPEFPDISSVVTCLMANISQLQRRAAVFEFQLTNVSTASFGVDFLPNATSAFVVIPASFSGTFVECINVFIFGDLQEEGDEMIIYRLSALSELDTVVTPMFSILIVDRWSKST